MATKGERTRERILDSGEACFARHGYEAASLREIARLAGIQEPGLYNYFETKAALYAAVLERALRPLTQLLERRIEAHPEGPGLESLAGDVTDLLCAHPRVASLFQDALRGSPDSVGVAQVREWLDRLFDQGLSAARVSGLKQTDRSELALRIIALFNVCTGYFVSQLAFDAMAEGDLLDQRLIARQKSIVTKVARALMADHK